MKRIQPYELWIGNAGDGRAFPQILDQDLRAVVQLAYEEPPIQSPREIILLRFPLLDGSGNDQNLLTIAIASVASLITRRFPTLICCGNGMSRSPALAAAALSAAGEGSPDECLQRTAAAGPTDVSPAFWHDLLRVLKRGEPAEG